MEANDGRMAVKIGTDDKPYCVILEDEKPGLFLVHFEDSAEGRRAMREVKAFLTMRRS